MKCKIWKNGIRKEFILYMENYGKVAKSEKVLKDMRKYKISFDRSAEYHKNGKIQARHYNCKILDGSNYGDVKKFITKKIKGI